MVGFEIREGLGEVRESFATGGEPFHRHERGASQIRQMHVHEYDRALPPDVETGIVGELHFPGGHVDYRNAEQSESIRAHQPIKSITVICRERIDRPWENHLDFKEIPFQD